MNVLAGFLTLFLVAYAQSCAVDYIFSKKLSTAKQFIYLVFTLTVFIVAYSQVVTYMFVVG